MVSQKALGCLSALIYVEFKMSKTKIKYWYKKLDFPQKYDEEFYAALESIEIPKDCSIENYDVNSKDGIKNLLVVLYLCDDLQKRYEQKGISEEILLDTLGDIVRWNDTWSETQGELYLGELPWLWNHLSMKLFKLGRLQFCMEKFSYDIPEKGIKKGDNTLGIHIPSCGPLSADECYKSIEMAKEFFGKFFPEFEYSYFKCHTWLLDKKLETILNGDSNILKFQDMFEIVSSEPSDAILRYVFKWNTTRENLLEAVAESTLAKKVKEIVLSGDSFNEAMGLIKNFGGHYA